MHATLMIELNPEAWNGHDVCILPSGRCPRLTGWGAQANPEIEVMLISPIGQASLRPRAVAHPTPTRDHRGCALRR